MKKLASLGIAIAALTFVASACSSTGDQVSTKVADQIKTELNLTAKPKVACPSDAKSGKGRKFVCTATIEGQSLPLDVTFVEDKKFSAKPEGSAVRRDDFEKTLSTSAGSTVNCGTKTVLVVSSTSSVTCKVTANGTTKTITFGWKDGKVTQDIK